MILMAIWTFPNGWRTHKVTWPSLLALIGVGLMIMAAKVPESDEFYWVIASGVSFISAHLFNRHLLIINNIEWRKI